MKKTLIYSAVFIFIFSLGCKKKETKDPNLYQVNTVDLYHSSADKTKRKTLDIYISVMYSNLFQLAMSPAEVAKASDALYSIGDKRLGMEVLVSNFLNDVSPQVQIPTNTEMRADIDKFIEEAYIRFLIRRPTEAEKTYFRNFITANPNLEAQMVYMAFATCNEYQFY